MWNDIDSDPEQTLDKKGNTDLGRINKMIYLARVVRLNLEGQRTAPLVR